MNYKRITLLSGHYGSGKTNIAVNMALDLSTRQEPSEKIVIADLDIVNPYYRSLDSRDELDDAGVRIICSEYANTNLDVPALPQDMYAIVDDKSIRAVIDVGGDERGALALGRISPAILEEGDYDMYLVINKMRPLTRTAKDTVEIAREIEAAAHLKFTAVINCTNLGAETTEETILNSKQYADEVCEMMQLPLAATAVEESLADSLEGKIDNIIRLRLQKRPIDA